MLRTLTKHSEQKFKVAGLLLLSFIYGYVNWIFVGFYDFGIVGQDSIYSLGWLPICIFFSLCCNLLLFGFCLKSWIKLLFSTTFIFALSFVFLAYLNEFWFYGQDSMCTLRHDVASYLFNSVRAFLWILSFVVLIGFFISTPIFTAFYLLSRGTAKKLLK